MEKGMEKEKNMIIMGKYMKLNITMEKIQKNI